MPQPSPKLLIRRHSAVTRVTHWVNALCLAVLLMSGLQIFNAHPALYWGNISTFDNPLALIGPFPGWATLPSYQDLASGRLWHFFFAWLLVINGAVYLLASLVSRHLSRDLLPTRAELAHVGQAIREHIRLRFPQGEEARRYNVLQQLAYLAVIVVLVPLVIVTGLCMSPRLNADFQWLPALFGGRQSARTVHFLAASGLLAFFIVHVAMVLASGFWNNLRSMITGRYAIETGDGHADRAKS
ncbi:MULTISPECIES: cytochrome b/b6 domain-containing protein [Rhodomicrobium]|uniref:cytochrome b/b6 domain-containing protein n=1 Tax=Rhodomicrobium TaxID=1068 RepID=UPI000B4B224B|nr:MULTISPECIES: cytochrome b/b6 domain-containing protein [Rhodomicrobium]